MIVRSILALAISATPLLSVCFSQTKSATEEERVFRAPFKLKLDPAKALAENDLWRRC